MSHSYADCGCAFLRLLHNVAVSVFFFPSVFKGDDAFERIYTKLSGFVCVQIAVLSKVILLE